MTKLEMKWIVRTAPSIATRRIKQPRKDSPPQHAKGRREQTILKSQRHDMGSHSRFALISADPPGEDEV
jgi:hypothetical protein